MKITVLVLALAFGGLAFADEKPVEPPATASEKTDVAPPPDENRPIENQEWRGVMHGSRQIREAAVSIMMMLSTVFTILSLGALLLFTSGVAPNFTARASVATRDHPLRSFFVGAVALFLGTVATLATKGILGIVLLPLFTAALFIGLAGVSEHLGRNVWHLSGKEGSRVGHLLSGWTVFSLVSIFPFIGWFGFFPYYCAVGVGAFFTTMIGGRRREVPVAQEYRGL